MYLTQCIRPNITFAVNLLSRFSFKSTRIRCHEVKHIFHYLQWTIDLGLFYPKETTNHSLVGYTNLGYKSDLNKARSQIGYLFCYNGIAISWCSTKQTLVETFTNHFENIILYETGKECVRLRSVISHIQNTCHLTLVVNYPTTIYENNATSVAQVRGRFVKGDKTKHILSKFFYTRELQESW